jgi:SET domain-containing protein
MSPIFKVFDLGDQYPHLCLVALREIHEDEELTFDYGDRWVINK